MATFVSLGDTVFHEIFDEIRGKMKGIIVVQDVSNLRGSQGPADVAGGDEEKLLHIVVGFEFRDPIRT